MGDKLLALLLFGATAYYLMKRHLESQLIWVGLIALFAHFVGNQSLVVSVLSGIAGVYLLSMSMRENFEGEDEEEPEVTKKKKKGDPEPSSATGKSHVDLGSTILHAYRNITPESIKSMREDSRSLLELQKELMGSLKEMKPAIESGAELLSTFSTFFGKDGMSLPGNELMPGGK